MTTLNITVGEFLKEFCDKACRRVDVYDPKRRVGWRFVGPDIDKIPEDLLRAKTKDHFLFYDQESMSHEIRLVIESSTVKEALDE